MYKRIHFKEKIFQCKICEKKKFRLNQALKRHMKTHDGKNPYKCQTCGKCFKNNKGLQRHEKLHMIEPAFESKVQFSKCKFCGTNFKNKPFLKRHEKNHTLSYEEKEIINLKKIVLNAMLVGNLLIRLHH